MHLLLCHVKSISLFNDVSRVWYYFHWTPESSHINDSDNALCSYKLIAFYRFCQRGIKLLGTRKQVKRLSCNFLKVSITANVAVHQECKQVKLRLLVLSFFIPRWRWKQNVYPLIHHQVDTMNYNIPFIRSSLRYHTFTVTIVIFILAFLLLFCWLIETDLVKKTFSWDSVWFGFYFFRLLNFSRRDDTAQCEKKKSKSNQSLLQFVSFSSRFSFDFVSVKKVFLFLGRIQKNKSVKKNIIASTLR